LGYVSSNNLMGRQDDYHPYYVWIIVIIYHNHDLMGYVSSNMT
jgi:hypothetical protein